MIAERHITAPPEPIFSHSAHFQRKRDSGGKPKSLCVLRWCRRGDSNPHGFPHHPLEMACLPNYTTSVASHTGNTFQKNCVDLRRGPIFKRAQRRGVLPPPIQRSGIRTCDYLLGHLTSCGARLIGITFAPCFNPSR
jgi:hypothetical protein